MTPQDVLDSKLAAGIAATALIGGVGFLIYRNQTNKTHPVTKRNSWRFNTSVTGTAVCAVLGADEIRLAITQNAPAIADTAEEAMAAIKYQKGGVYLAAALMTGAVAYIATKTDLAQKIENHYQSILNVSGWHWLSLLAQLVPFALEQPHACVCKDPLCLMI